MTTIAPPNSLRRAFGCWPSRIGAVGLVALAFSLGSEAFATTSTVPLYDAIALLAH